ncbi:MAG TPA: hypothetical protein VFZ31_10620 [Vicinamibacterales bacterium]
MHGVDVRRRLELDDDLVFDDEAGSVRADHDVAITNFNRAVVDVADAVRIELEC